MKTGVCCSENGFEAVAKCGYEYVEPVMALMREKSADELKEIRKKAEALGLTIDGFNCFFGGGVSLYGGEQAVYDYAEKNFETANILGASYCVIGSGAARRIPDGGDKKEYTDKFTKLLKNIGKLAEKHGLFVALEPLQHAETNFINTLTDGIDVCRAVNEKSVGGLVDFYHFFENKEELSEFDILKPGELYHVHLARPDDDRGAPTAADLPTIEKWAAALKNIGYDGRVSLECTWKGDFYAELETAFDIMKVFKGE